MTVVYPSSEYLNLLYLHGVPIHLQTGRFGPLIAATMTFLVSKRWKFVMIRIQAVEPILVPELHVRPLETAGTVLMVHTPLWILPVEDLPLACMAVVRPKDRQRAMTSDLQLSDFESDELGRRKQQTVKLCGVGCLVSAVRLGFVFY